MQVGIANGSFDDPAAVETAVIDAGVDCVTGRLAELRERELACLLVDGATGVHEALQVGTSAPVLPVGGPAGLEPVARADLGVAVAAIEAGEATRVRRPRLRATFGDARQVDGIFEVATMTTGPAQISEFEIRTGERSIGRLRADGVVVVSPAGSGGYGADAGGPILAPGMTAVAVVPISSFLTQEHVWVVSDSPVRLRVARDESTVGCYVDGRAAGRLGGGDTVTIGYEPGMETLRVPPSASPYRRT